MMDDSAPEAVSEFAKSFQALVNVVSPDVNGRLPEQADEMKAGTLIFFLNFFGAH